MTLEKVYQPAAQKPSSILRFLQQNNPYASIDQLLHKAGLSKPEVSQFLKQPDSISFRSLSKLLFMCDADMKLTIVSADEAVEEEEISDIFVSDNDEWEDSLDLEEDSEDVHWV